MADRKHNENKTHLGGENCPLYPYCITQKGEHETCDDMVRRYNARLLLPPENKQN